MSTRIMAFAVLLICMTLLLARSISQDPVEIGSAVAFERPTCEET
jgi:hypothetical protein